MAELLRLLRAELAEKTLATEVADWPGVFNLAVRHGIAAYLYPFTRRLPAAAAPPPPLLSAWRQQALQAVARHARIAQQAGELLGTLRGAGIRCVPIKGVWLAETVYAEGHQRPMCDIDLLLPQEQIGAAIAVLQHRGYEPKQGTVMSRFACDLTVRHPDHPCPVELHWQFGTALQPRLPCPPMAPVWANVAPATLHGQPVEALPPEEHLVLLAYHTLHHRFAMPLRAYLDVALLVRATGSALCGARYRETAHRWGIDRGAMLVVRTMEDLIGVPLPEALTRELPPGDWAMEQRQQAAELTLWAPMVPPLPAATTLWDFRGRGWLGRLRLVIQRLCMPRDFMRQRFPAAASGPGLAWAYIRRGIGLAGRMLPSVASVLLHHGHGATTLDETTRCMALLKWSLEKNGDCSGQAAPRMPDIAARP